MEVKFSDILMIVAVLLAPLVALQVQIWLDRLRAYVRRKDEVFRMLMGTRGTKLSPVHIEALNRIDLEFYGWKCLGIHRQTKAEKKVVEAWRAYHNHLGQPAPEEALSAFYQRRDDLFVALLRAISDSCGYTFDETHLKEMSYTPIFYGNVEADQTSIRQGLAAMLSGNKPLSVQLIVGDDAAKNQEAVTKAILAQAGADGVLRVRLIDSDKDVAVRKTRT